MLKKKEKLEQMRELGRGGLSKGLHFLRTAKSNASLENSEADSTLSTAEEEGTTSSRMTYEELLALSMKLTRQNKLMKLQHQKTQTKLAAASRHELDIQALRSFLELELGLDVTACTRTDSTTRGSIDVDALKTKYRTLAKVEHEGEDKGQTCVESVNLLDLSPVKKYEEIDLLAGENRDVPYDDAQMDEAMQQVERMREQLKQSAQYTQDLEQKLQERIEQQEQVMQVLAEKKREMEEKELEWESKWKKQVADNCEKTKQLEELETKLRNISVELEASDKQREEVQKEEAATLEIMKQEKRELMDRLHRAEAAVLSKEQEKLGIKHMEAEGETQIVTEVARADDAELEDQSEFLQTSSATLESQAHDVIAKHADNKTNSTPLNCTNQALISEAHAKTMVVAALGAQQAELDAAKVENKHLQSKLQELQQTVANLKAEMSDLDSKKEVEVELKALQAENSRLNDQLEHLQQTAASLPSGTEMDTIEVAENTLQAEIDQLKGLLDAKNNSFKALQQEVVQFKELLNAQEDTIQKVKVQDGRESASLMQELERVRSELAESMRERQSIQKKLSVAEDNRSEASNKYDIARALVDELKRDTDRLTDQVTQFEKKQIALKDEIAALSEAKLKLEEQNDLAHEAKAALEKQMEEERAYWTSKLENLITASDTAKRKTETLEAELEEKKKQILRMSTSHTSMTSELMDLQKQANSMREDLAMAADSLEAHATKAEEYERRSIESEKEVAELRTRLDEIRDRHHENFEMLRKEKEGELERVHAERRTLLATKTELCKENEELRVRCKTLERELEATRKHVEELDSSLREKTLQVDSLSSDIAETKKSLSDRMALATRLQTENMGMAGKLAEQVALIESAMRDVAKSKATQQEMENQVQAVKADLESMKKKETALRHDLGNVQREMLEQGASFQQEREESQLALQAAVESEKNKFRRELDRLESESKNKSRLALQAVMEKEKEILRLSARLHEVEEDVRSGGADNRKIVELAQLQAKREVEQREQAAQLQALFQQLEEAHHQIQELREDKRRRAEELTVMLQNQRRDGVNMEYLKNVVVQYMSFRPGTSEQARLVPVLTTLLQFTAKDIKEINRAARRGNSWTSWRSNDYSLEYKPIVVGSVDCHSTASPSSTSQGNGEQLSSFNRKGSAPVPRISPPAELHMKLSRASSFVLTDGEPHSTSTASADF